jgi:lysine-specific demethylase 8
MAFCGHPRQAIQIAADPSCLPGITTAAAAAATTTEEDAASPQSRRQHDLIPCRHKCGHVYCSLECQQDDWEWGGHQELCTGWIQEEEQADQHPLLKFKIHARETNEIFLLIATWLVRILKQNVPYNDDDKHNTHPYTDFMMNPWWDVKTMELMKDSMNPGAFAEAISLEKTLRQLCEESHSYLQEALPEMYKDSPWLTPLGMARLIGSLEQNCLGIRRKHGAHRNIMEDTELRHEMHQQLIQCLERSGMVGGDDCEEEEDDDDNDDNDNSGIGADGNDGLPNDNGFDTKSQEEENDHSRSEEKDGPGEEEKEDELDYSYDDIAEFLANLSDPLKADMDDEWDEIIRPLDGTAHFTIATKMNHSCDPNVILLYKTRGWGRDHPLVAYCVALKDISEGEELTICYIDANETYEKRQEALANYGFTCACEKCEKENNSEGTSQSQTDENPDTDENELFGNDDDVDDEEEDINSSKVSHDPESMTKENETEISKETDQEGESKLLHIVEQIDTVLNKSTHGAIPIIYLAPASSYVLKLASNILKTTDENNPTGISETIQNLLNQFVISLENRDFASCRIVGADLELFLYNELKSRGSFPDPSCRAAYWCSCITASIGYAHEGSFLMAMKYLDMSVILGLDRHEVEGFLSYVEMFSTPMASGPCPVAIDCKVPNYHEPSLKDLLSTTGLSKPIEFEVDSMPFDLSEVEEALGGGSLSKPFVIRGVALEWPAVTNWRDMGYFCKEFGHRLIPIEMGSMTNGMKEAVVSFRQFVSKYLCPSTEKHCWSLLDATDGDYSQVVAYLAQHPLLDQIPALYQDVERNPCGVKPTNVNIWMGSGGTRTPLHYDSYDNLLVQLVGSKYVRLYSSEDTPKLYGSTNRSYGLQGNMSDVDCEMEDFDKHPLVKDCNYQEVLLLPGDCLFIPSRHWHYVRSLSTSISINYWF